MSQSSSLNGAGHVPVPPLVRTDNTALPLVRAGNTAPVIG